MDPINGVNSQNYAISTPQQNNQIQNDYSSMPMVYEPEMEEKKKASSSMLGMTALGLLAIGGIGYGIHRGKKVDGLKQQISQLSAEKEALGKAKDEVTKALDKERTLTTWERFKRLFKPTSGLTEEEVKARNAAKEAKKKAAQEVKDAEKSKKSGNSNNAENKAEASGTENTANKTEESK